MSLASNSVNKRRVVYRNLMVAALGVMLALSLAGRVFAMPMHLPMAVTLIGVGVLSFLQFNTLDEMAKQAHYIAWYWGGLVALSAVALLTVAISFAPPVFAAIESVMLAQFGNADAQTSYLLGLITAPALLVLGFAGWWSVYWLRRR